MVPTRILFRSIELFFFPKPIVLLSASDLFNLVQAQSDKESHLKKRPIFSNQSLAMQVHKE